jgi:hypothetical protein
MNAYLVTIGSYEGYEVLCIYLDEAEAQAIADAINKAMPAEIAENYIANDARVERYPLNRSLDSILATRLWS